MSDADDEFHVHTALTVYLDGDDLAKLGLLSVLWSQVEFCVEMAIFHLKGVTFEEGRRAKIARDISQQINLLKALVGDQCPPVERRKFLALLVRAESLAVDRNLAIHGHWARLADHGGEVAAVSWRHVAVGDELRRLEPHALRSMCIEAGAIAKGIYDLLSARGAFPFAAEPGT